jgi:hypothetical protein
LVEQEYNDSSYLRLIFIEKENKYLMGFNKSVSFHAGRIMTGFRNDSYNYTVSSHYLVETLNGYKMNSLTVEPVSLREL